VLEEAIGATDALLIERLTKEPWSSSPRLSTHWRMDRACSPPSSTAYRCC
jgi:hypothetical protein